MPFDEILGQAEALMQLRHAVETDRLAHSYIFVGPQGVGKSMTARALARMLLCADRGTCKKCSTCELIIQDNHPFVRTFGLAKGARNISVDIIRDNLIPFFNLKSAPGEYKVAIINPADALSEDAANMLLKTLEEPNQWSLLILISKTIDSLLSTIISRCHRIRFARIPDRLIVSRLIEKMDISQERAQIIAKLSGGSIGKAIELAGKDFSAWRIKILDTFAELIEGKVDPFESATRLLDIASQSSRIPQERREELQNMLDILLTYMRDLAIAEEKYDIFLLHEDRPTIEKEAVLLDEERVFEIFNRIFEAKDDIEKNVNMQLTLEEFCLDVHAIASAGGNKDD